MKRVVVVFAVIAALGCAEEPEVEVTETAPATETEAGVVDSAVQANGWWIYTDWDADANQQITRAEFDTRMQSDFAEWDVDGDGALGHDEAADAFWDFFDPNDDNIVDSEEWSAGVDRWRFDGVDWGTYETWDADTNAELAETEWRAGWDTVWNDFAWDADGDGTWSIDEASDKFWDFFDRNDDDIIDAGEWGSQD